MQGDVEGGEHILVEIESALADPQVSSASFYRLESGEASNVIATSKSLFVEGNPWHWWFALKRPTWSMHCPDGGWRHLLEVVPTPDQVCYFIPEVNNRYSLVYEARPADIVDVLGNCFGFVYYLVDREFQWILGEDDSDVLFICTTEDEASG